MSQTSVKPAAVVTPTETGLVLYDKMCTAIAECHSVDEAKEIRDKARALEVYAQQAMNTEAECLAAAIRIRAERRTGELLIETQETGQRQAQGGDKKSKSPKGILIQIGDPMPSQPPKTLKEIGITPKQSSNWQQLAAVPAEDFEAAVATAGPKPTTQGIISRAKKKALVAQILKEPPPYPDGPFRVLVLDPPWRYESRREDITHRGRCPYPDMSLDEIKSLPVANLAQTNCVVWLWTTNAFMREAFECLDAWGFECKTILTWMKDRIGLGNWLRGQSEHCLMAVRGKPVITLTNQSTALIAPVREHSRKPDEFYALVESLCPGSKLEMFARRSRDGWQFWGAELEAVEGDGEHGGHVRVGGAG